jgi:AraC-like DNA-binding protein
MMNDEGEHPCGLIFIIPHSTFITYLETIRTAALVKLRVMRTEERRDFIEVWRPPDMGQLEARRGFGVARPVPRHWHEEYQLCLIQAGSGELIYRGHDLPTPPASLFMVHPGEVHSNRADDRAGCSYRTLFVGAEAMSGAASEAGLKGSAPPFFPTAVVYEGEVIRQYLALHCALERPASSLERQTLLLELLAGLVTRYAERRAPAQARGTERQAVARARDFLAAHYVENVTLAQLARVANLSPFHFSRVFAEETGMPPHAFQTQMRVARAAALLREGWPIPQAASQTGFADQSHLTRHFKRLVGVTPGRYAQKSKNVQDRDHRLL